MGTGNVIEIAGANLSTSDIHAHYIYLCDKFLTLYNCYQHTVQVAGTFSMDSMDQVKNLKSPRVIKTHLSIDMLPEQVLQKKAKVIYVTRNPRDAVVSFFNHWRILENYTGTFEVFLSAFLADVCGYYTPFIQHVLGYWNKKNDVKMLFLTYEEMKADLPKVIKRVADFLAKSLTDEEVTTLADHLSFNNMSNNAAVNKEDVVEFAIKLHGGNSIQEAKSGGGKFMRKGEVGDWQNHLTEEQSECATESVLTLSLTACLPAASLNSTAPAT